MNDQDREHLQLLSIFYYVYGGLHVLVGFVPLFWAGLVTTIIGTASPPSAPRGQGPPPEAIGGIFIVIALMISLFIWAVSDYAVILAGRCMSQQKHYILCMIVACFLCTSFPLGTALGVFTIVVLQRPSVKALFDEQAIPHRAARTTTGGNDALAAFQSFAGTRQNLGVVERQRHGS